MKKPFIYMILFAMTFMVANPLYFFSQTSTMAEIVEEEHKTGGNEKEIKIYTLMGNAAQKAVSQPDLSLSYGYSLTLAHLVGDDHSAAVYCPPEIA